MHLMLYLKDIGVHELMENTERNIEAMYIRQHLI